MLKVSFIGLDQYSRRIQNASKNIRPLIDGEIQAAGMMFRDGAKRDLISQGGDSGGGAGLLGAITYTKLGESMCEISAEKFYAPFIEFGTKGKYRPIPGFEDVAALSKGVKRGNWLQFIESIKAWVKRKGIVATYSVKTQRRQKFNKGEADRTEQAAWAIALSIYKNGIAPTPFFFKQVTPVRNELYKRIEAVLNGL